MKIGTNNYNIFHKDFWNVFFDTAKSDYFTTNLSPSQKITYFNKYVTVINLETSAFCNRKCSYCPMAYHPREQRLMKDEVFFKIIDNLREIGYKAGLSTNLFNEPLASDDILRRITCIRKELPDCFINFDSNGDYLTREYCKKLEEAGLNEIAITLHFGEGEMYNDELAFQKMYQFIKKLGVDEPQYNLDSNHSIKCSINVEGLKLVVATHNWEIDGCDRGGSLEMATVYKRTEPCASPFREIAIDIDGNYRMCCNMFVDSPAMNNIMSCNVLDFYFSPEMNTIRKNLLQFGEKIVPCNTCNTYDYSFEEDNNNWNEKAHNLIKQ